LIPLEQVRQIERRLQELGKDFRLGIYAGLKGEHGSW
jgi:hypothetical protein